MFLNSIRDTINILIHTGNFGAVSKDDNSTYGYCIVKFASILYIIQDKAIFDEKNVYGESVVNEAYFGKLIHGTK